MEGTRLLGIDNVPFVQVIVEPQLSQHPTFIESEVHFLTTQHVQQTDLVTEEAAADVDLLTSNNNDLLASKNLLGNNRSQTAQEVAFAINDDRSCGERGHSGLGQQKRTVSKRDEIHS